MVETGWEISTSSLSAIVYEYETDSWVEYGTFTFAIIGIWWCKLLGVLALSLISRDWMLTRMQLVNRSSKVPEKLHFEFDEEVVKHWRGMR